jgi:hypothetical protein
MKKIVKFLGLASFFLTFFSCEMDLVPTTAIELEQGFKTYADAVKFANGMHAKVRNIQYGIFSYTTEVQGDMFNASVDYGNRNGSPHRLDVSFTTSDYNLRDVWRPSYNAIMNINNFIVNIDKITTSTPTEAANVTKFKGWAHFYRAFCYHELVRRYAKDYEPATAATELGVPLILTFSVTEKPLRATIQKVYDQIEADLALANTYLAATPGVVRSETPTIDAVLALSARVKLYSHKYAEAASIAQTLISSTTYGLSNSPAQMTAEFLNDAGNESIVQMFASLTETGVNEYNLNALVANNIYLNFVNANTRYQADFIPTLTCINMYDATDLRRTNWFETLPVQYSTGQDNLVLFTKYFGNPALYTAPTRNYVHKVKMFRIAEMYLIRAEALLNQPAPNAADALIALNALQTARGATLSATATMAEVKKEWAKETIGEGFRIDCLRRWKDGFSGRIPQIQLHVSSSSSPVFQNIVVTANEPKLTWAIPQTDMDVNPNLVQNGGW